MEYRPQARICIGCWQHMRIPVPLRGVASAPFRVFGIRPSRMNPNTCTICEMMFTKIMRKRQVKVDATVLFADLRGYTSLSQAQSPEQVSELLDDFYDECSTAIWTFDGLLNKTMGDAVMAVFNFPILRPDHTRRAVMAARALQERWRARQGATKDAGIGIGLACGELSFGEFGRSKQDLTAIGTVVNTASRAQSVAGAGEILLTEAVYARVPEELSASRPRDYQLKGFETATKLYSL
jgi:adenylate cyclase